MAGNSTSIWVEDYFASGLRAYQKVIVTLNIRTLKAGVCAPISLSNTGKHKLFWYCLRVSLPFASIYAINTKPDQQDPELLEGICVTENEMDYI